ncbi:hypothetical protein HK096_004931, partial [Nowakowskiella sp. JEL0078]
MGEYPDSAIDILFTEEVTEVNESNKKLTEPIPIPTPLKMYLNEECLTCISEDSTTSVKSVWSDVGISRAVLNFQRDFMQPEVVNENDVESPELLQSPEQISEKFSPRLTPSKLELSEVGMQRAKSGRYGSLQNQNGQMRCVLCGLGVEGNYLVREGIPICKCFDEEIEDVKMRNLWCEGLIPGSGWSVLFGS